MAEYTLPHFGAIDIDNLEEYYLVTIESNGKTIHLDLNFEEQSIDTDTLEDIKTFIERIDAIDKINAKHLANDFHDEDGETVKLYMEHHLEELDQSQLSTLVNFEDTKTDPALQLLSKLNLVRIGIYPQSEDFFASFDYSIGLDLTDYLVVIYTDKNGGVEDMVMES